MNSLILINAFEFFQNFFLRFSKYCFRSKKKPKYNLETVSSNKTICKIHTVPSIFFLISNFFSKMWKYLKKFPRILKNQGIHLNNKGIDYLISYWTIFLKLF